MALNPKAFGCAFAILLAAMWFLAMSLALLWEFAEDTVIMIGSFHPYFSYSWSGAIIITLQHLVSGLVFGYAFAVLYNKLLKYVSR